MDPLEPVTSTYRSAAFCFADLVARIPEDGWANAGLGVWDLRALVGHAGRALSTVTAYLRQPATSEAVTSPEGYFALVGRATQSSSPDAVAERGRQAGRQLGADPAAAIMVLVEESLHALENSGDALIETIAGGMYLRNYLPTRTFELAVHSLDTAAAAKVAVTMPAQVLLEVTGLAARIAVDRGDGVSILTALTGRRRLPDGFTVV
ncbi:maleylpyruvate isomerase N-terminal domain-containing protein [Arthrobacter sp. H14-L1]|uniref:maleylpyruvate isomerase N-terminal domain-containing protein n=1 Tax=Arthrobacter sp. H14-L1 TaxID=2996697 RepID=UPI0022720EB0|nr:maleylpyruvate isomerase N-terminal domain-containing protein [Arthrobacter sp. H14-L1]MCY0904405.1 maleylpyruvate isomerase N-terminal domain-containing protein [Arthrobacter sp. H14-L1]